MANLVVHFEIHASEPQRLIDFYSELLGWGFEQFGETPYWTIATGEGAINEVNTPGFGINGGLALREGPRPEPGAPVNGGNIVVSVDDADAAYARAIELGGAGAVPPEELAGVGRVAYLHDPDGNLFGIISDTLADGSSATAS